MANTNYQIVSIQENNERLIDISNFFAVEPSYFQQGLSSNDKIYLREGVVNKLESIQVKLAPYKFKIWDGYRPRSVQHKLYNQLWDELKTKHSDWSEERLKIEVGLFINDADDPNRIPPHASGGAVDLTLVDTSGKELDMGTAFDYFGPEAHAWYFEEHKINDEITQNRKLLREAMVSQDFAPYPDEWWHFDYGNQLWAFELGRPYSFYGEAIVEKIT